MTEMITKDVLYFGKEVTVGCDANCRKAWGSTTRPSIELDPQEPDDVVFLADDELGEAPEDPGTYEGFQAKPTAPCDRLNKWCVRACERSAMAPRGSALQLPAWNSRVFNMAQRHAILADTAPGRTTG